MKRHLKMYTQNSQIEESLWKDNLKRIKPFQSHG
jgi:hypothetical protein